MRTKIIISLFLILSFSSIVAANEFESPPEADFSHLGWSVAFGALHEKFSTEYAFSTWKNIDWVNLKALYGEKIARAEKENNPSDYENALKGYVLSIPDGHVGIHGGSYEVGMKKEIQGSYGITIALVENNRVIVNYVDKTSAAARAGIEAGAEILYWNNIKIQDQLKETKIESLVNTGIATDEHLNMKKCQRLARDFVGSEALISWQNPSDNEEASQIKEVRLTAYDDKMDLLNKSNFITLHDFNPPTIEYKTLSGKYGYILIKAIIDIEALQKGSSDPHEIFGNLYNEFHKAMAYFVKNNIQGLIVDLRGNAGGSDELASKLAGFFYNEKVFYERQSYYNAITREFDLQTFVDYSDDIVDALYIEPQSIYFDKPVIAMVDPGTISSGEGVAMGIQNSKHGHVAGFYGTNGSFGMTGGEVTMPGNIHISYPYGRSLDKDGIIQLDSKKGSGGVTPDFLLSMTSENAIRLGRGEDLLLEFSKNKLDELCRENDDLCFIRTISKGEISYKWIIIPVFLMAFLLSLYFKKNKNPL